MQMTVRNIPKEVRKRLESEAKRKGKSLNQAALDALARGVSYDSQNPRKKRDLSFLAGSMTAEDARAIEESVAEMDRWDLEFQKQEMEREKNENRAGHKPLRRSRRRVA